VQLDGFNDITAVNDVIKHRKRKAHTITMALHHHYYMKLRGKKWNVGEIIQMGLY